MSNLPAPGAEVLRAEGLTVKYGPGAVGVQDISFTVHAGEIVALVGPNGGGKTSSLRGAAGFLRREGATVRCASLLLSGKDVASLGPRDRVRKGLVIVPEREKIFLELSVLDQLHLAWAARKPTGFSAALDDALDHFPDIREHLHRRGGYLSGGQRQMVALASAMCAGPHVLLVDEATLGLAPSLVNQMGGMLRGLADAGIGLLIAEQSLGMAFEVADVVHVLDAGRVVAQGSPAELQSQPGLVEAYLGRAVS